MLAMELEEVYPSKTLVSAIRVVVIGGRKGGEEQEGEGHGRVEHDAVEGVIWRNVN